MKLLLVHPERERPSRLVLGREELHRLRAVKRLRPGDRLELLDAERGLAASAVIGKDDSVEAGEWRPVGPDPHPPLVLAMACIQAEKLEWAAQRAFELGLAEFWPFESERVQGARGPRQAERLALLARAACEQSGRRHLPRVREPAAFEAVLEACRREGRRVAVLDPTAEADPGALVEPGVPAALLVGPEGGFSPPELELAAAHGAVGVGLAGHVLRAETAAVAVTTLALARWGWLGPRG